MDSLHMIDNIDTQKIDVVSTALQSQKAVTAYFKSKQLLPFGFARQCNCHRSRDNVHESDR